MLRPPASIINAAEIIYEDRTDEDGTQYSYGTFVFPEGTEAPEGFDGAFICRMHPGGRVAEIVEAYDGEPQTTLRFDEQGNQIYFELNAGGGLIVHSVEETV